MPSLVVHYALVGLLAATVPGAAFDNRSLLLSLVVIPVLMGAVLCIDPCGREESYIQPRWGLYNVWVAWFRVVVYGVGHVLFDAVTGGASLFCPVYDQFHVVDGRLELSGQRGIV